MEVESHLIAIVNLDMIISRREKKNVDFAKTKLKLRIMGTLEFK